MGHKPNVAEMKGCSNENSSVELEEVIIYLPLRNNQNIHLTY